MTSTSGGQRAWEGHRFACVLRVDVEHREAERYTGDPRTERVATSMLLDQLVQWGIRGSFPVLGVTASHYPDVVRWIAEAGHDIMGHSMFHEPAYSQMPLADQRWDHRRSRELIERACGVRISGIAAHYHGLTNDETYLSAALEGVEYLLGKTPTVLAGGMAGGTSGNGVGSNGAQNGVQSGAGQVPDPDRPDPRGFVPFMPPAPDGVAPPERPILARAGKWLGASDWSARRQEWPWIEEPWSAEEARVKWRGLVDQAYEISSLVSFVIHPWMLHINEGEIPVVRDVLQYARERGAWMTTYGALAERAQKLAGSTTSMPSAAAR
jgi:peptidoglycan/xylan/chitin deacetylase (PgdA/CDA1 family)